MGDRPFVIVVRQRTTGGSRQGSVTVQVETEYQGDVNCGLIYMWV